MFKKGMIRFRRKMAAVLAAAMLFSSYPVPAYAAGGPDVILLEKRDTETSFTGAPARAAVLVQDGTTAL